MVLLAHWPLDDGDYRPAPPTARDVAAGGSGSHAGTYTWGSGGLRPTGVGGHHFESDDSYIDSIGNPSDLILLGSVTAVSWLWCDDYYHFGYENRNVVSCVAVDDATIATNDAFWLRNNAFKLEFAWQYGAGQTQVTATTSTSVLPYGKPSHVAAVRYQISPGFYGVKFYVDGILVDTQDNGGPGWAAPTGGSSCVPYVGYALTDNNRACYLDSVRIYDSEESTANILAIYDAEKDSIMMAATHNGPNSSRENSGWAKL